MFIYLFEVHSLMAHGSSWYSSGRLLEPISALVAEYNFIWLAVYSVLKLSNVSAYIGKTICAMWLSNYNRVATSKNEV